MYNISKRIIWIDIVKIFACILVVLGHLHMSMMLSNYYAKEAIYYWFPIQTIYTFHVPLFFVCSGYLYQMKSFGGSIIDDHIKTIISKGLNLIIPYIFFSLVTLLLKVIFSADVNNQATPIIDTILFNPVAPYWFLYALFFLFCVIPRFKKKRYIGIFFLFSLFIKYIYIINPSLVEILPYAIRMIINPDGFYQPEVNENLCINCGVCVDVCSFQTEDIKQNGLFDAEYFAGWSHDKDVRHKCSSGGVGFEIARYLLEKDYVAIVCGYNSSERRAKHFLANTIDELKASVGSKYIQSNTYYAFSQLQSEKKYLVVGTPCQIDSIRRWVKRMKMDDSVILMDFFCHGVPSLLMWDKYLAKVEGKIGRIDNIVWRDKEAGWHDSWVMKVNGC